MSKQEFSRLDVLLRVQSGRLRVSDACVLIGLQRRHVLRLLRGLKQDGATSLLSKRRGRPTNHRLPAEIRTLALSMVRERYSDFGPSLAAEKLAEHHGSSGRARRARRQRECHLYLAQRVTFLPCADIRARRGWGGHNNRLIWGRTPRHETFISSEILRTG